MLKSLKQQQTNKNSKNTYKINGYINRHYDIKTPSEKSTVKTAPATKAKKIKSHNNQNIAFIVSFFTKLQVSNPI